MSTSENTSKNRKLFDEVRDVMMLYKEKIVAVTILSTILSEKMNSNSLIFYLSRFITILPLATSFMLQEYAV